MGWLPLLRPASWVAGLVLVVAASTAAQPAPSSSPSSPAARIAIDETIDAPAVVLTEKRAAANAPSLAARITTTLEALADAPTAALLDARIAGLSARGHAVWLAVETAPPTAESLEAWSAAVAAVSSRVGPRAGWLELTLTSPGEPRLVAFGLKRASVDLHAVAPAARLLAGGAAVGDAAWLERVYAEDVASYLDGLAAPAAVSPAAAAAAVAKHDASALVAIAGQAIDRPAALVDAELARLDAAVAMASYRGAPAALRGGLAALAHIADLTSADVVRLDPAAASLALSPAPARATLVYDTTRFGTALVYARGAAAAADVLEVAIVLRSAGAPIGPRSLHRREAPAARGEPRRRHRPHDTARAAARRALRARLRRRSCRRRQRAQRRRPARPSSRWPRSSPGTSRRAPPTIARSTGTSCRRGWSSTSGRRPPIPGFDVVTENRYFADRAGVEWEELSFSVNGTKWGPDRPAVPAAPGREGAVAAARPAARRRLSLSPRRHRDGRRRRLLRRSFHAQHDVDGEVALPRHGVDRSRDVPAPQAAGGADRPRRARGVERRDGALRQGRHRRRPRHLPAHRNRHPADRAHRRAQHPGREGDALQRLRAQSGRPSRRDEPRRAAAIASCTATPTRACGTTSRKATRASSATRRRPAPRRWRSAPRSIRRSASRCRSSASTTSTSSSASPDSQLALLFGGVLVLGNIQRPKLIGPIDGSVDFFAIAVPGSDRVYDAGGSREAERVLTWPLSAGGNLGWQYIELPEGAVQLLAELQRLPQGPHDRRGFRRAAQHHHARHRPGLGVPPRPAIRS